MAPLRQWLRQWWSAQARGTRIAIGAGAGAVVVVLLIGGALLASGGGGESAAVVVAAAPATATASATATAETTSTPSAAGTEQPGTLTLTTLTTLKELKDRFGEAPDAKRGRFRIPRIGVDAALGQRAVRGDGNMPLPSGPADVVVYDFSAWPSYGGEPGSGGNAVFSAHLDYADRVPYAQANYRGPGVFRNLELLSPGDMIEVQVDGQTLRYAVEWRRTVSATGANWPEILARNVGGDAITLITCGGDFNVRTLEYNSRVIVRAVRV